MRALTAPEIAATEAVAFGFRNGLEKRDMADAIKENHYAVEAQPRPNGFSVGVRDNRTKKVLAGAEVGPLLTFNDAAAAQFQATGDDLAGRIEAFVVRETLAGGEAMLRGERVLREYLKGATAGTPFAQEPFRELQSEDYGIGNAAITLYATDSAIAKLGSEGLGTVGTIKTESLRTAVERASRHVYAKLDVDQLGRLIQTLKVT